MSFGDNLRKLRKERNISQEDLAELLNVSRQAISKWEQNSGYPEMEKVIALAGVLNVSLDYLVLGEDSGKMPERQITVPQGKIMIKSYDGRHLINCYKISSSAIFKSKSDEPKYALYGVDSSSFWGESSKVLGWYAKEEDVQKEIDSIIEAMENGVPTYELKYAAKVKGGIFSVKLIE